MKPLKVTTVVYLVLIMGALSGCGPDSAERKSDAVKSPRLPKLTFHRPKDISTAVKRIQAIHDSLVSNDGLPQPVKFEYVEVIHGEGAAGHSHYYLASEYQSTGDDHDHDHHHGEMEETIKRGTLEVGFRTELEDLAGWLPDIAAMTDLDETAWTSVKDASGKLKKVITSVSGDATDSEFREAWRSRAVEVAGLLAALNKVAEKAAGELY